MIDLWPHWLRPGWLILLPLCGWLLWKLWHRQRRAGRWQTLLPPAFHDALLSGGAGQNGRLRWVALGCAWLLALLALLGPSWQRIEQADLKAVAPLVVILELTPQILATDAPPTRLDQARRKILDLLQARNDAQTALVVYAGSAHTVVPLSDDLATLRNLLDALHPSIMPEPGQRADLAVVRALALLEQAGQGRGELLLMSSSLSEVEKSGITRALGRHGDRLLLLGLGTPQGAPIALADGAFMKDANGSILLPRLDAAGLSQFAGELGGGFSRARPDDGDLRQLGLLDGARQMSSSGDPRVLAEWADQGHWLLLPLLLLAACAGRRGWLFCLPLLLTLPQPSQAFEFRDLWFRPDQQGQRLLEQQRPAEAAERFRHPQWQGLALYQAGEPAQAAERFALDGSATGHYNRGNALARAGELDAALEAYQQALEQDPDLEPALANKALIEELLRQREAQSQRNRNEDPQADPSSDEAGDSQGATPPPTGDTRPDDGPQAGNGQQQAETPPPADDKTGDADGGDGDGRQEPVGDGDEDGQQATETLAGDTGLDDEKRQALEQWLRQIPDEPGELLRRKFRYEQQQHQEQQR